MGGRRTSLASLAGQVVDDVPGRSDPLLLTLPVTKLVPTRFNPRRNFGGEEALKEFGLVLQRRQLQPAVVVSRAGYLKLWPEEENAVGDAPYVIANGERRWRGSLAAGLETLNVVHDENVASSRADFLDAILSENNDREDLDPIERALGIETMVLELGGADQVAAHFGKTKGWVSQQRKLLKLTPELQQLISVGEMPVRVGREIAGLPSAEQARAWNAELDQRAAAKAVPRPTRAVRTKAEKTASPEGEEGVRFTAVNRGHASASAPGEPSGRFTAVNRPDEEAPTPQTDAGQVERFTAVNRSGSEAAADDALVTALRVLMNAAEHDVDAIAEVLGQNLRSDVLKELTAKLQSWI